MTPTDWIKVAGDFLGWYLWVMLAYYTVWSFMLFDCLKCEEGIDRLTWVIVLIFVPILGPIYYFVRAVKRSS